jgi:hypothetical protein
MCHIMWRTCVLRATLRSNCTFLITAAPSADCSTPSFRS